MKDQSNFSYIFLLTKHKTQTKIWTRSKKTMQLSVILVCVAHTNTQAIKFNIKKNYKSQTQKSTSNSIKFTKIGPRYEQTHTSKPGSRSKQNHKQI